MKKIIAIILIILPLTGCYDRDINKQAYLMAIGVDQSEYTFQFANPINFVGKENGFGSEAEQSSLETVTVTSDSIYEAFSIAQSKITKIIDTSYLKIIIFNKLYNNGNIGTDIKAIEKSPNFHKDVYVAICETSCKDFLENSSTTLERNPAKYYENIFNIKYNEYSTAVNLKSACNKYVILPVVTTDKIAYKSAIVKDGMINSIHSYEDGKIYNIVSGNLKKFGYFIDSPKCDIKLSSNTKPTAKIEGDYIELIYSYDCEVLENKLNTSMTEIKRKVKSQLTYDIEEFINKYYKEYDCDIMYYKNLYKRKFLVNNSWEQFDGEKSPKDLLFKVTVNINSDRNGEML